MLRVQQLGKRYPAKSRKEAEWRGIFSVSFDLERGRTLALVGASGSGKSTLARCLAAQETPDSGAALLNGQDLFGLPRLARARAVQLVFQQPAASLNPRFSAEEIVAEPLRIAREGGRAEQARRAAELMEMVGLPAGSAGKRASWFSGGEAQRLALARALALSPKLLILDESLSGLDVSLQAQMVRLLAGLRQLLGLALMVISHDLDLAVRMADELAVMDEGRIVEHGPASETLARPAHPRTRELAEAWAVLGPGGRL